MMPLTPKENTQSRK